MKLSDLIIEHGQYGDRAGVSLWFGNACATGTAAELNELREELMAARAVREEQGRFHVESGSHLTEGVGIWLVHNRCGRIIDEPLTRTLAELNQRAGEHAEVCR